MRFVLAALMILAADGDAAEEKKPGGKRPWMGMSVRVTGDAQRGRYLHVERTAPGGPADRSGIRPGDIITRINDASLRHMDDLEFLLFVGERKPGERVKLDVIRNGTPATVRLTVGVMPPSAYAGWERALRYARQLRVRAQR